jgi:tetratricopeptide (TPR) repeat protein
VPETSLRAYGRQIDELIEKEKLEEAIAHCRYILQTYPKHLETYRLLGKAYLENKRYGDATDIFQRVLSAVPDDFVSHIGMAIVREDEGNLDAAIWHMERAFETNPSNPAIQQEMKRLIGRRDGLEPHKVRLTRGALARMYAQGELYSQAISELRSALQEDPDRPDLQVLLADMYWRTDQRAEATSISNQILEKLPYCVDANRVLAANLQTKERIEEAAVYHRRLASLDPYAAFIETATTDAETVEESAVTLEKLEWQPGEPMPTGTPSQPSWAATLGMEMQRDQEEDEQPEVELPQTGPLPSWLEPGEPPPFEADEDEVGEELVEVEQAEAEPEEPDWLEEESPPEPVAEESSEEDFMAELEETSEYIPEMSDAEPEAEPESEIPNWMQDAGWTESSGEVEEQPVSFTDDELRTLEAGELPPEPAEAPADEGEPTPADEGEPTPADEGELAPADLPDWIQDIAPEEGAEEEPKLEAASDGTGELPTWLASDQPAGEAEAPAAEAEEGIEAAAPEVTPDEAEPVAEEAAPEISFPAADDGKELPTWITEESPGATDTIVTWLGGQDRERKSAEAAEPEPAELPDWMTDTGPLEETSEAGIGIPGPDVEAEATADAGAEEAEPVAGAPSWLSAVAEVAAHEERPADASEAEADVEGRPEAEPEAQELAPAEPPDWLTDVIGAPADTIDADEMLAETAKLKAETAEPTPAESEAEPSSWVEVEDDGTADWLQDEVEAPAASETPDWLKGLAEEGAEASETARTADAPDWLRDIAEPGRVPEAPPEDLAEIQEEPEVAAAEPELPSEFAEVEPAAGLPEAESAEFAEVEPAAGLPEAEPAEFAEVEPTADLPEAEPAEFAEVEPAADLPEAEPAEERPSPSRLADLLKGELTVEPTEPEPVPEPEPLPETEPEFDLPEPEPLPEPSADSIDAPDWLQGIGEDAESAIGDSGAPDWLAGIAQEDEIETVLPESLGLELEAEPEAEPEPETELIEPEAPAPPTVEEDDEVIQWLEDLASAQEETEIPETIHQPAQPEAEAPMLEERQLPEDSDEGLEWLEELADQRGLDIDVGLPQAAAPSAQVTEPEPAPEPEPELTFEPEVALEPEPPAEPEIAETLEPADDESATDWLTRLATQPIPKVDLEALEAAAAEKERAEAELAEAAVDPAAETIKTRSEDLQAELARQQDEAAEELPPEPVTEDEVPEWLIQAAEQSESEDEPTALDEFEAAVEVEATPVDETAEPSEFAVPVEIETVEAPAIEEAETEAPVTAEAEAETIEAPAPAVETAERLDEGVATEPSVATDMEAETIEQITAEEAEVETEPSIPDELETAETVEETTPAIEEPVKAPEVEAPPPEPEAVEIAEVAVQPTEEPEAPAEPAEQPPVKQTKELAIEGARQALASGEIEVAVELYGKMIKKKESLEAVIEDLRIALDRTPDDAVLWQTLGDAYMKNDQSAEAIEAYRQGMEAA